MLSPKRTKFQRYPKNISRKTKQNQQTLSFGNYGIVAKNHCRLSARTIEAIRRILARKLKRKAKIWTCVFPHTIVTKKPAEVRMGKGKGKLNHWAAMISKGQILFEIDGVSQQDVTIAFSALHGKLPFPVQLTSYYS